EETRFQALLQTGGNPVAGDLNATLEVVVFDDPEQYQTYSYVLFGNSTDNGGIYLEGDPADPANQARLIVYEANWLRPAFEIWNLGHEYPHYLDGRFDMAGAFADYQVYDHRTLWWIEGLAEYVAHGNDNPPALEAARTQRYDLSTILTNT